MEGREPSHFTRKLWIEDEDGWKLSPPGQSTLSSTQYCTRSLPHCPSNIHVDKATCLPITYRPQLSLSFSQTPPTLGKTIRSVRVGVYVGFVSFVFFQLLPMCWTRRSVMNDRQKSDRKSDLRFFRRHVATWFVFPVKLREDFMGKDRIANNSIRFWVPFRCPPVV